MFGRRHPWWLFAMMLVFSSLVSVACEDLRDVVKERAATQPQNANQKAVVQVALTSTPTLEIRPTSTPLPPPLTPMLLPTNSPLPRPEAGQEAQIEETPMFDQQVMVEIPAGEFNLGNVMGSLTKVWPNIGLQFSQEGGEGISKQEDK